MSDNDKDQLCISELKAIARVFREHGDGQRAQEIMALAKQIEDRAQKQSKLEAQDRSRQRRIV